MLPGSAEISSSERVLARIRMERYGHQHTADVDDVDPSCSRRQFSDAEVSQAIADLAGDESGYIFTLAINVFQKMVIQNPARMSRYVGSDVIYRFYQHIRVIHEQKCILTCLCAMMPHLGERDAAVLIENGFAESLQSIIVDPADTETLDLAVYLAAECTCISYEFRDVLIRQGVYEALMELKPDGFVVESRSEFLRNAIRFECHYEGMTELLWGLIVQMTYSDEPDLIRFGLEGMEIGIKNNPNTIPLLLRETTVVCRIAECLTTKPDHRNVAVALLKSIVAVPEFPMSELFKYKVAHSIVEGVFSNDAEFAKHCVGLVNVWMELPERPFFADVLKLLVDRDMHTSLANASYKQKCLVVDLIESICMLEQCFVMAVFHPPVVDLLCEFIAGGEPADCVRVLNIVTNAAATLKNAEPMIMHYVIEAFNRIGTIDTLRDIASQDAKVQEWLQLNDTDQFLST